MKGKVLKVFTDGSACILGERLGGFGIYALNEDKEEFAYSKGFINTKTGRMEISAVLYAIKLSPLKDCHVTIYSDSQYVVKTLTTGWIQQWKQKNWEGVKNKDLWEKILDELSKKDRSFKLKIIHIRGHNKDPHPQLALGNHYADRLADYKDHKTYQLDLPPRHYFYHEESDSFFVEESDFKNLFDCVDIGECNLSTKEELNQRLIEFKHCAANKLDNYSIDKKIK